MTIHRISTYRDGNYSIQFCSKCGVEGTELYVIDCFPTVNLVCNNCGQSMSTFPCKNCERIREMFKKAIDKQNSRN